MEIVITWKLITFFSLTQILTITSFLSRWAGSFVHSEIHINQFTFRSHWFKNFIDFGVIPQLRQFIFQIVAQTSNMFILADVILLLNNIPPSVRTETTSR